MFLLLGIAAEGWEKGMRGLGFRVKHFGAGGSGARDLSSEETSGLEWRIHRADLRIRMKYGFLLYDSPEKKERSHQDKPFRHRSPAEAHGGFKGKVNQREEVSALLLLHQLKSQRIKPPGPQSLL